jgi:CheY-like chemotaxis protein
VTKPLHVLIVDDDPDNASAMAIMLELSGHAVEIAQDGPTALAKLAKKKGADVVLLDLGMPGMDGWEVARMIYEQATETRPYIIAVSGRGMRADKARSRESGIDLHLVKPVEPETLETILQGLSKQA